MTWKDDFDLAFSSTEKHVIKNTSFFEFIIFEEVPCEYLNHYLWIEGKFVNDWFFWSSFFLLFGHFLSKSNDQISKFDLRQGRKWLPKTGWASSNVAHLCRRAAAWRDLWFCQNWVGNCPLCPPATYAPVWSSRRPRQNIGGRLGFVQTIFLKVP